MSGPLHQIKVLDLSRILAGPTCTQMLGDLGADVIKVEKPGEGDDTRRWGPPFVEDPAGEQTDISAYYLSANRNKRSVEIDLRKEEGAQLIRTLLASCDVLVENFKVGDLARYGLDYPTLAALYPRLVYCSISGFGQTGPRAQEPGYDFLIQAMGGIMSLTGEPDGRPMKAGVGIADVMCGMYATVAILAALRHRDHTGEGQHIDLSLLDTQVAWLVNGALNYFVSGALPKRRGNGHPNIVPYQTFETKDGTLALAAGNDAQFARLCGVLSRSELASDPRFATNAARLQHREALVQILEECFKQSTTASWVAQLGAAKVPSGPVNRLDEVFDDPQIRHREMRVRMPFPAAQSGSVDLLGNPVHYSKTPIGYRRPPPHLGEHTDEVLREWLQATPDQLAGWRGKGIIG